MKKYKVALLFSFSSYSFYFYINMLDTAYNNFSLTATEGPPLEDLKLLLITIVNILNGIMFVIAFACFFSFIFSQTFMKIHLFYAYIRIIITSSRLVFYALTILIYMLKIWKDSMLWDILQIIKITILFLFEIGNTLSSFDLKELVIENKGLPVAIDYDESCMSVDESLVEK